MSLTKNIFTGTIKKTLECHLCHSVTENEMFTNIVNIYPDSHQLSMSKLLEISFRSQVTKRCEVCSTNTVHSEVSGIEHHPNILIIVINRFNFGMSASKNHIGVTLNRNICLNTINYDLIGSVHHHGESTSSGHYTSKLYYKNVVYGCNDHLVTELVPRDEISNSAYIVFYKQT